MKKTLFTLLLVSVACVSSLKADKEGHSHDNLKTYVKVATALSKDDLAAAKKAAASIAHDKDSALAKPAGALAKAKTIKEARMEFQSLSQKAVKMAKGREGYYVMHCPMVKGGAGSWVQADKKVANPYFGAQMLTCGGIKN